MLHHFCAHALHLYQPTRTADRSQQNHFWHFRETLVEHLPHHGIICRIAQVNQHLSDVIKRHFCFLQQGLHVFPHAFGLFPDITRMHHFTPVIDTGRTGYENLTSVAIIHIRTTLKTYSILIRRIQMSRCI